MIENQMNKFNFVTINIKNTCFAKQLLLLEAVFYEKVILFFEADVKIFYDKN